MVHLYADLDIGSGYFTSGNYDAAIEVFDRIMEADPYNFMAAMRLAVAYSVTDRAEQAQANFERARTINPSSVDLRHYHAMHYLRNRQWNLAEPLFESVLAEMPDRLPALEGLATIYSRQNNDEKTLQALEKIVAIKASPGVELVRLGQLHMARGRQSRQSNSRPSRLRDGFIQARPGQCAFERSGPGIESSPGLATWR